MMSVEEALAQAELISDDENWVRIEKYPYKSFYEDEEETFIDLEKREISDPSKNVSTLGENNSQLITFVMDRYADGVDLVDMLIQIQYKLQSGEEATAGPVNVYASDDKIKFGWAISNIQTQVVQTIQFIVYCTGKLADGESYLLKTKPMSYRIENTLGTGGYIEKPSDEWFLQFEETMNQKMNQVETLTNSAIDSAAGAKESEQNAAQSASTASTLAGQVQSNTAQAKASADAAKVSEQNAKKSEDAARVYAGNASAVANVQIGTSDTAGLLRGGDIHVDESGALKMITPTTETTMPNSCEGRLRFKEIIGNTVQLTYTGKNLVKITLTTQTFNGVKFTVNTDKTITANGTATADIYMTIGTIDTEKDVTYMINGCPKGGSPLAYGWYFNSEVASGSGCDYGDENPGFTALATETKNCMIFVKQGVTLSNLVLKPMIRLVSITDDTYEPYTGGLPVTEPTPQYPLPIKSVAISKIKTHDGNGNECHITFSKSIELNKIGDVQDVIVDGKPIRRIAKKRITSSMAIKQNSEWANKQAFVIESFFSDGLQVYDAGFSTIANILCTHAATSSAVKISAGSVMSGVAQNMYTNLFFSFENCATLDAVKTFLDTNVVYVYYELATPTTEALPIADQIGLNSLATYDGITYVEFDSEIQPTFKAEYGTSKAGGYTLESLLTARNNELRITALEATNEEV